MNCNLKLIIKRGVINKFAKILLGVLLEVSALNIFYFLHKYFSPLAGWQLRPRKVVKSSFNKVWSLRLADALRVELEKPRLSKKSVYKSNVGNVDDSPEVYYRNSLCIPLLGKIINQLNSRFPDSDSVSKFLYMIPALMVT